MSLAAISALLLVCLVHRGEVSSAPCGEDLGVSLAASLGSRGGSSFPYFLKATTAPVSASRPVTIQCCQSRSVLSKKQESTKDTPVSCPNASRCPLLSASAGPFSTSLPNPHLAGHGKRKDHPLGRPQATDSGHPHGVAFVPGVSIWGFAFFCGENGLDLKNWFCFL